MLKLIVGTKGSGKTKTMIDMIDKAVKTTSGNIVVIEKCMKLTTEINHSARLVDVDEYGVAGADMLYGFVAGVLAGNYDITELFLDGTLAAGPMVAGLLVSGGVGLLVLWRTNADLRQNAAVTGVIYAVGVAVGLLVGAAGMMF